MHTLNAQYEKPIAEKAKLLVSPVGNPSSTQPWTK